jgi:hypothetical protein
LELNQEPNPDYNSIATGNFLKCSVQKADAEGSDEDDNDDGDNDGLEGIEEQALARIHSEKDE